jgi:predicted TIM-barrel fold metal-dependent hydrolase
MTCHQQDESPVTNRMNHLVADPLLGRATQVLRLVDAHHHIWDLRVNRYPWLQGDREDPAEPLGVGMLQRNYLIEDFLRDVEGLPLKYSVHVEAAAEPADTVRETRWLQTVAERTGLPSVFVPYVALERPDAREILAAHLESPNVRGVRQMLDRDASTGVLEETALMEDSSWRAGLRHLAQLGLTFDLQVLPSQLDVAARLASDFGDTVFVLNHGGYHVPASAEARMLWKRGVALLGRSPNVVVKVSGFDAVDPSWEYSAYKDYVLTLLEIFGTDRSMFASNFPVDARTTSYSGLVARTEQVLHQLTDDERDRFFYRNALRVYRLDSVPSRNTLRRSI